MSGRGVFILEAKGMVDDSDPVIEDGCGISGCQCKELGDPRDSESFQDFERLLMEMGTQP